MDGLLFVCECLSVVCVDVSCDMDLLSYTRILLWRLQYLDILRLLETPHRWSLCVKYPVVHFCVDSSDPGGGWWLSCEALRRKRPHAETGRDRGAAIFASLGSRRGVTTFAKEQEGLGVLPTSFVFGRNTLPTFCRSHFFFRSAPRRRLCLSVHSYKNIHPCHRL